MNNFGKVVVMGLGYVGYPLSLLCANRGFSTVGFDIDAKKINSCKQNQVVMFSGQSENQSIQTNTSDFRELIFSSNPDVLSGAEIVVICVPTPTTEDRTPDLQPLFAACDLISNKATSDLTVIIESTIFPGTCEKLLKKIRKKLNRKLNVDIVHCPERISPGDPNWNTSNISRVIGAMSDRALKIGSAFYTRLLDGEVIDIDSYHRDVTKRKRPLIIQMRSIQDAEAVKVMENASRDINIAIANEFAIISDLLRVDVIDVIRAMDSKPFGKGPFYPGAGVGGHCIAVDPDWLRAAALAAGFSPELINSARLTNNSMPEYFVSTIVDTVTRVGLELTSIKLGVLGVSYKPSVSDSRESPFFPIKKLLTQNKVALNIFDPFTTEFNTHSALIECLRDSDVVAIVTAHPEFIETLETIDLIQLGIKCIIDGRNCIDQNKLSESVFYKGIGRPHRTTSDLDA